MKQLVQHLGTGNTILEEIPVPAIQPGHVLIKTVFSLVSAGTEKMLVEFSKANLITKARKNPDRVTEVFNKIKTDGIIPTIEAVFRKLDEPLPLGYCNAGVVIEVGDGIIEFKIGDRVASNGGHAEYVCVPQNLVVKIPAEVSDKEATFTVIGAIALQSIRLAEPKLGETVVVIGLGLIGLITAQLLNANGCNTIGVDIDEERVKLAQHLKINAFNSTNTHIQKIIDPYTNENGADAIIITASAKNDILINTAAKICRKKGKIILVGVTDMNIDRTEFFKKELSFQVSCSYGPGRYDENYEQKGIDYPYGYVRWTEKRNFETILNCIAIKQLDVNSLITENVPFANVINLYNSIGDGNSVASLISYPETIAYTNRLNISPTKIKSSKGTTAIIGAGNFTSMTLLPALKSSGARLKYLSSNDGLKATLLAKKYKIENVLTENKSIFEDSELDLIIISTRHDTHASLIIQGLKNRKNIFTEKPIALTTEELQQIEQVYNETKEVLFFAGFNRRFSPFSVKAKELIGNSQDLNIVITINAGNLAADHWLYDEKTGGGRIIGDACHFFDLMSFFTGSEIHTVYATDLGKSKNIENTIIHLTFKNGAHGTINYFANGIKSYPKERVEIFAGQHIIIIDNFKKLQGYGFKKFTSFSTKQNKGHHEQFLAIMNILKTGGVAYTSFESLKNTTKATFAAMQSIKEKSIITIN